MFARWNIYARAKFFLEPTRAWNVGGPYLPFRRNPATMGFIIVNP
jgi:hypothetical protein